MSVPVISLGAIANGVDPSQAEVQALVQEVDKACRRIGFMVLVDHGVDDKVISECWDAVERYFDLPAEEKARVSMDPEYPFGYCSMQGETLSKGRDGEVRPPDLKESFSLGPPVAGPERRWPARPEDFQKKVAAYYSALNDLADRFLSVMALALDLPVDWFKDKTDRHQSALRMLNYPKMEVPAEKGQMRASEHTDYGTVTFLRASRPGLQVIHQETKEWWDVVLPEGRDVFVVNLGDLMQRWTNDQYVSTMHRVVADGLPDRRQSIAFFHNLNKDAVVEAIPSCVSKDNPAKYPKITAGEHLMAKHLAATTNLTKDDKKQ